jgi:stage II sporulation protein D
VLHDGEVSELPMEDYLIGVVAAEMPADFETEALRAQAVAARTFTLYCARTGKHRDADVCTDYRCCQAWKSPAAMCEAWGERFEEKLSRVRAAVDSTAGQYLSFAGEAVFAAFHSSSAGFTEDCDAIWSGLPYLVSVSSPESADSVPNYVSCVACSPQDLRDALLTLRPEADFSGEPTAWLGEIARDRSGRVAEAVIGGAVFPGVKLRELFGLRSTAFELDFDGEAFQFTVTGFGHGVGMSQYGANVMAAQGADYTAILAHYYPGTELVQTLS